jgi:hypothetical protein
MNKSVILDPTGLYPIPSDCIPITTEVEWMRSFLIEDGKYWVQGQFLCNWTEIWLRSWNRLEVIEDTKQHPQTKLNDLLFPVSIPETWTEQEMLDWVIKLENNSPEDILSQVTEIPPKFWLTAPSLEHLAQWLTISVHIDYQIIEKILLRRLTNHPLTPYYQTEDKLELLRQWIGILEPALPLAPYPLPIPEVLREQFNQYWERQMYQTHGEILDTLNPTTQAGIKEIASIAYKVLTNRPNCINQVRVKKLTPYLNPQQKQDLQNRQPVSPPPPLKADAKYSEALTWVTQSYLPFRRWDVLYSSTEESDRLASSFVDWVVENYPTIKITPVSESPLNYNVAHHVQNLSQKNPVFWVVVDGLGWLDHLELIDYLSKNHNLVLEADLKPRFSVLPTITKYAKWSLYSQLLPKSDQWVDDIGKGFDKMGMGERYTDGRMDKLYQDLQAGKESLYCWDTILFDKLQHDQKDWDSFYNFERPKTLKSIAERIHYCIQQHPNPENLTLVIASDHGQILGKSRSISFCPPDLDELQGRMALGTTDDPNFVVLEGDRYDLPHDVSIIKDSSCFNSQQMIGCHGGLFPEEVVIGFSVLTTTLKRSPVIVTCRGEGRANQSGKLEITINNYNSVSLTNLSLYIKEIPSLNTGKILEETITPQQEISLNIEIPKCPEIPHLENIYQLPLTGTLTFEYANSQVGEAQLELQSLLTITQVFSSGFNINLDEF